MGTRRDKSAVAELVCVGLLCGTPSLAHSRLVVNNDERCAIKKGFREDKCAHTGGGVVLVGRLGWIGDAHAGRLYRRERRARRSGVMVVGVVPPRRAGRKTVRMAVSIDAK